MVDVQAPARVRLDVWLDVVCLYRTRSEAQKACQMGRVEVNGQRAKAHRDVKPGDELEIHRPMGHRQRVIVRGLADKHLAKTDARKLYEDVTPPPTPDELEFRRLAALARPHRLAARRQTPSRREQRALRELKGSLEDDRD